MDRKLLGLLVVSFLVSSIPAPIPTPHEKRPITQESSQAKLGQQQHHSGTFAVVGQVPSRVSELGSALADRVDNDSRGGEMISSSAGRADLVGGQAIVASEKRIVAEKSTSRVGLILALLASVSGYVAFVIFRRYMNKILPAPKISKKALDRL